MRDAWVRWALEEVGLHLVAARPELEAYRQRCEARPTF
ncbi:hypothetical protein D187_001914 [Cystobacter fuscus DSM 2262]|uniref:Uncharacterized protein n=1 Tax=Cystobacter fuscus (strain ATCC 25194 / DSM 2262 / NBRC 100088 / M29) TaxID=1242864 RepID=S9PDN1_CYSF2|nr:hypothetical protein D187_001914 [Cystobacter fuscus DSM 2262]